jgi:regulator of RNase E activity RraB
MIVNVRRTHSVPTLPALGDDEQLYSRPRSGVFGVRMVLCRHRKRRAVPATFAGFGHRLRRFVSALEDEGTLSKRDIRMSDNWEMYFTTVDDEPAAILVDLGIGDDSPDPERPVLLWAWIHMKSPTEDGFASEEEEPLLTTIEDTFIDAVELTTDAVLVGRVTTCGRREFYFYARSSDGFDDTIAEAMEPYTSYEYETGEHEDSDWAQYFDVLFPGPEDAQQIYNRRVIEELSDSGDTLTTPRPVDHFASFPSAEERASFIAAAKEAECEVVSEGFDEDEECDNPYSVALKRVSAVDPETIDEVTFELFEMAQNCGGEYDGWGSAVVKE